MERELGPLCIWLGARSPTAAGRRANRSAWTQDMSVHPGSLHSQPAGLSSGGSTVSITSDGESISVSPVCEVLAATRRAAPTVFSGGAGDTEQVRERDGVTAPGQPGPEHPQLAAPSALLGPSSLTPK